MSKLVCPLCGKRYPKGVTVCESDGKALISLSEDPFIGYEFDKYRIKKRIGKGGFGVVYLAEHQIISNQFAVKVLRRQFLTDEQLVSRFLREAKVVGQINHENIVQTIDYGQDSNLGYYYVMEYLEGDTLTEMMQSYPRGIPIERLLPILRYICSALDKAHLHGIVHRDLKPANILLIKRFEQEDIVKILDFGIAKVLEEHGQGMTVTGQIVGSPRFMSPEQARGQHSEVDARSDIYSLGVMVFWMLTGRLPFDSKKLARLLFMHVKVPAPRMSVVAVERNFSRGVEEVVASALAKSKENRPSSAGQFYRNFEAACRSTAWEDTNPETVIPKEIREQMRLDYSASVFPFPVASASKSPEHLSSPPPLSSPEHLSSPPPSFSPRPKGPPPPLGANVPFAEHHGETIVASAKQKEVSSQNATPFSYEPSELTSPKEGEFPWLDNLQDADVTDETLIDSQVYTKSSPPKAEGGEVQEAKALQQARKLLETRTSSPPSPSKVSSSEVEQNVPIPKLLIGEPATAQSRREETLPTMKTVTLPPKAENKSTGLLLFLLGLLSVLVCGLVLTIWWYFAR